MSGTGRNILPLVKSDTLARRDTGPLGGDKMRDTDTLTDSATLVVRNVAENPYKIEFQAESDEDDDDELRNPEDSAVDPLSAHNTKKSLQTRLALASAAIGLLFITNWGTAAGVVRLFYSPPTVNEVYNNWTDVFTYGNVARLQFVDCAQQASYDCNIYLNETIEIERLAVEARQAYNLDAYAQLTDHHALCMTQQVMYYAEMRTWFLELAQAKEFLTYNCAESDRFKEYLENKNTTTDLQALSVTQMYAEQVRLLVRRTQLQIDNFSGYVTNYYKDASVKIVQGVANATGLQDIGFDLGSVLPEGSLDKLNDITNQVDAKLNATKDLYQGAVDKAQDAAAASLAYLKEMQKKAIQAKIDMDAFVTKAKNFYSEYIQPIDITGSIKIPVHFDFNNSFSGLNLALPNYSLPPRTDVYFGINMTDQIHFLSDAVKEGKEDLQNQAKTYEIQVALHMQTMKQNFNSTFGDYNPPPIIFQNESKWDTDDRDFSDKLYADMKGISSLRDKPQVSSAINKTLDKLRNVDFVRSAIDFSFEKPKGEPKFESIMGIVKTIAAMVVGFDATYRVWKSVAIFVRYWGSSAVGLPDIDIRKRIETQKVPLGVKIGMFLSNPYFVLFVVAFLLTFGITTAGVWFGDLMLTHQEGCVKKTTRTWTIRNMNTLAYNGAVAQGNFETQKGAKAFDSLKQGACSQYVPSTDADFIKLLEDYQTLRGQYKDVNKQLELASQCWDPLWYQKKNKEGLSFSSKFHYSPQPQAEINRYQTADCALSKLDTDYNPEKRMIPSKFNCSQLQPCNLFDKCNIDEEVLYEKVLNASCTSERFFLMNVTSGVLQFVTWLLWNIGRILFFMGLSRLLWKLLVPRGLNYLGTCDREGKVDETTRDEVPTKAKAALAKFHRWGYIYIVLGFTLQLGWIVPVPIVAEKFFSGFHSNQ